MKHFNVAAVLLALGLLWQAPVFAQVTGMSRIVGTCGTAVYTAGKFNYPTQDTTGAACGNASGGSGGVAGLTAEATATAVAAGTNKPQSEDTTNGAARTELCVPGTTTCIDPSGPSGIKGVDGSTISSATNPAATAAYPTASGGLLACTFEVAASDNHQNCGTAAAHQVYSIQGFSIHTAAMFMRLYNIASFNACNSATGLVWEGQIPGVATGAGFTVNFPSGLAFGTAIGICVTGAFGNTNTTSATASVASVNIQYK